MLGRSDIPFQEMLKLDYTYVTNWSIGETSSLFCGRWGRSREGAGPTSSSAAWSRPAALKVQIWSYQYAPEPTGIGPVSRTLALGLRDLGHDVDVVAGHPHYPDRSGAMHFGHTVNAATGSPCSACLCGSGEHRNAALSPRDHVHDRANAGVPAFAAPTFCSRSRPPSPPCCRPWQLVAPVASSGALVAGHSARRCHSTGLMEDGPVIAAARRLERAAYRRADLIAVISDSFATNLRQKGVSPSKLRRIYNPATRVPPAPIGGSLRELRVLSMGNIGYSQGLIPLSRSSRPRKV